ncbi:hypothetical protein [Diaminobutyricimonas sp. LJ205]|uniref:hypothetical protein n=1 Tax=Diaminobutyricimonas sp. LJ205 TaxID=2683590 RepID=UPI0012F49A5E|nr:hypothetical protein [Diaminobutyricimonas sp. LJ205]
MKLLPIAALVGATVMSTIALTDAIWAANLPGTPSPWSLEAGNDFMLRGVGFGHAIPYLLLAAVLLKAGPIVDAGRRFVAVVRWILIVGFALFGILFGWDAVGDPRAEYSELLSLISTGAFIVTLLVPIVLGFALIRRRELRLPVLFLIAPVLLFPLTLLLAAISTWGHPAYLETAVNFGVALLGIAVAWSPGEPVATGDLRQQSDTVVTQ